MGRETQGRGRQTVTTGLYSFFASKADCHLTSEFISALVFWNSIVFLHSLLWYTQVVQGTRVFNCSIWMLWSWFASHLFSMRVAFPQGAGEWGWWGSQAGLMGIQILCDPTLTHTEMERSTISLPVIHSLLELIKYKHFWNGGCRPLNFVKYSTTTSLRDNFLYFPLFLIYRIVYLVFM